MIIIETPNQSDIVLETINSSNSLDWPIQKRYPGYEKYFLAFHPFLIVKSTGQTVIIPYKHFPSKSEIVKNYDKLSWTDFLKTSGIIGYKELDDCLAFYHSARVVTNKLEFKKLIKITESKNNNIIEAQVDYLPEIIEDSLLTFFIKNGYKELYIYDDIYEEKILFEISDLYNQELNDTHCIKIQTPDEKILVVEDFDQRFTYFLGDEITIQNLIQSLDLEGFYCDACTTQAWSYGVIDDDLKVTWDGKNQLLVDLKKD